MAATNKGTCQCCGSIQKLPKGVLSLHGYRVINGGYGGWFTGSCPGSGHLPLEQDCSLVQGFADRAKEAAERDDKEADAVQKLDTSTGMGYLRTKKFQTRSNPDGFISWDLFQFVDGQHGNTPRYQSNETAVEQATSGNKRYSDYLGRRATQHLQYADQMERILKRWEPKPLLPL